MPRILLLILPFFVSCESPTTPPLPALGTAERPLKYDRFTDVEALFHQTNDTTYVVNFWATWCKPCREEIPFLQQLAREEADQKLRVVLISLDTEDGAIERIPAFLSKVAPDVPAIVLTDEDPSWGKTIDRVWTGSLPTTIIYKGKLRYVYRRNFNTYVDLQAALEPLTGK